MSDFNEEFGSVDDLADAIADDDEGQEEEQGAEESEPVTDQEIQDTQDQLPTFDIDGEKVDKETIKAWREAHQNRENWTKSNTHKAQEIAEQRKQYEEFINKHPQYEKQLEELNQWNTYLSQHPELLKQIQEFTSQNPNQAPGVRQKNPEVDEKIQAYEKRLEELEARQERERVEKERQAALQSLSDDPNFKQEDFMKFFSEKTQNLSDLKNLYNLMWMAYKGSNMDSFTRKAHDQAAKEYKQKKNANVEQGNKTNLNNLPNNVDASASVDDLLEDFFSQQLRE